MNNKEKFKEVFGFMPDTETMIPVCPPRGVECPFMDDGIYSECHCELWWSREYKAPDNRNCGACKHRVMKVEVGKGTPPEHFWGCECWECEFEPTTKNNLGVDCISRQAVLERQRNYVLEDGTDIDAVSIENIFDLPSVTPQEPKTGHWIKTGDYYTGAYEDINYVECSCCGKESLEEGDYCPNCGAKMVEPQESEVEDGNDD